MNRSPSFPSASPAAGSAPPPAVALVDAHAHLADPAFDADREAVLERARAAGVEAVILVGEGLDDARRNLELAARHPLLRPCGGLHPARPDLEEARELTAFLRERASELVGIGEVGLDHWLAKDEESRSRQRQVLGLFVDLSLDLDLPLNVHSRAAGAETIAFLAERGARRVLLHAFDGKASRAERALELGYFFSVPPSVVRSRQKEKLVGRVPLDHLLLETDSPVLAPVAGERNEPANVKVALEAVARIKGLPPEEVARRTTGAARRLFPCAFARPGAAGDEPAAARG